jgi:aryl-alcohol dehydrogenase-like predicted oxidoreductase
VEIGQDRGVSAVQVCLAWSMNRPGVASLVVGARNDAQLLDNLAAVDLQLSTEETARLDALSNPPLVYPYWHHLKSAAGRLGPADLALVDGRSWQS